MGKAKARRIVRRTERLKRLFEQNPDQFNTEWSKRTTSWLYLIRERAEVISSRSEAVFEVLDEALKILKSCGDSAYEEYGPTTYGALASECCRVLNREFMPPRYVFSTWNL
jgi:hypothetical protein